ncbi:MAG: hypothetical protein ABJA78_19475 [Ferruginibacter sp.]
MSLLNFLATTVLKKIIKPILFEMSHLFDQKEELEGVENKRMEVQVNMDKSDKKFYVKKKWAFSEAKAKENFPIIFS